VETLILLWRPILEILFIWALVYNIIRFFQGTRALQVLTGLMMLAAVFNLAKWLELHTVIWVLTKLFAVGVLAILVIFQPELRRILARIGQNTFSGAFLKKGGTVDEVVQACEHMSRNRVGALFAIERDTGLKNYIESGIVLDAKISAELLITIFMPVTPIHDGGVVVVGNRIASCGCLFPLSQNMNLSRSLGTRHRAAIGLTEESDAVCVIVSEETGAISVSVHGKLTRDLDPEGLKRVLLSLFRSAETQSKKSLADFLKANWTLFKERNAS